MLPRWRGGKEPACNAGGLGSIPGLGRSPGGGNGNPLQYSCLENPMNRRAWRAPVHKVTKSQTRLKQLSMHTYILSQFLFKLGWYFLRGEAVCMDLKLACFQV